MMMRYSNQHLNKIKKYLDMRVKGLGKLTLNINFDNMYSYISFQTDLFKY